MLTSDTTAGGSGDGLAELVSYEIHASGGGNDDWLLLRIFPPIFFDEAC